MEIKATKFNRKQFLFLGFLFHLAAAYFSFGYHQCDELFQIYEFAGYKLGINLASDLPWEFGEKMRSGIQPLVVYIFTKGLNYISVTNPITISIFLRLFHALLSFWAMVQLLNFLEREITNPAFRSWLWCFGFLYWCLPYFHARLSSENFSSTLFLFGFLLCVELQKDKSSFIKPFFGGILMGLAFLCRFQISFMIASFIAWQIFIQKAEKKYFVYCFTGLIASVGIGLLVDKWFYSTWVFSWWNYLDLNFFRDVASNFGTEPVYYYLTETILQLIPPFSLAIVTAIIYFWVRYRNHLVTWVTLPFVILHSFIPHKELRFLFPVLNFLPFMVLFAFEATHTQNSFFMRMVKSKVVMFLFILSNIVALAFFSLGPADQFSHILKEIYYIADNKPAAVIYKNGDPYSKSSLNYFKNRNITTYEINTVEDINALSDRVFYFTEIYNPEDTLVVRNHLFTKVYSNYPAWFRYLNFNGWIDRSNFSIYALAEKNSHP